MRAISQWETRQNKSEHKVKENFVAGGSIDNKISQKQMNFFDLAF
jgi:hypothetical protein